MSSGAGVPGRKATVIPLPGAEGAPQPVQLGVVMLCHERLPLAARMARLWVEGGACVAMHVDAKAPEAELAGMRADLADLPIIEAPRRPCSWGTFSLVAATQDAAAALIAAHPQLTHVILVSGACLPLRPIEELRLFLARSPDADFIESVDVSDVDWTIGGLSEERFTLHFPVPFRRNRKLFDRLVDWQRRLGIQRALPQGINPHIGSQWWCLTTRTLGAILSDPRREEFDQYFRRVWIPDESYFQTLARRHSVHIESRSLTLAKFDHDGKPYVFYDDHRGLLANSRIFVARKIWPGARALYDAFPKSSEGTARHDEPDTERIEALLERGARRRQTGRPGLYMQSRYPRKDSENGKTSQPYAVIYGLGDVYVGLRGWLAAATRREVHGAILSDDEIEFSSGGPTGPGALSANPGLRDLDPQGFLTSLVRSSSQMPAFHCSPRDDQSLNWFLATDPNARLFVLTGAWVVPLLQSDMPFDDIRRISARMQRAEFAFLGILESVWVKARVRRWALADVIAAPDEPLSEVFSTLRPEWGDRMPPAPPLRDMSGVEAMLRRLRNAGLKPRGMGNPRLLRGLAAATEPPTGDQIDEAREWRGLAS